QCLLRIAVERAGGIEDRLVRAMLLADGELVFGGRGRDDARTHRLTKLDGGEADATRRTEHEKALARLDRRPVLERVMRGAIGHEEGRRRHIVHLVRDRRDAGLVERYFFRKAPPAARSDDAV